MSGEKEHRTAWTELRDGCAAVRELALVTAIALLLVAPSSFHSILERAGITSVVGIEFNVDAIEEVNQETHEAAIELESVKQQLVQIEKELSTQAEANHTTGMQQVVASLHKLEARIGHAQSTLNHAATVAHKSVPSKLRAKLTPPEVLFKDVQTTPPSPRSSSIRLNPTLDELKIR